VMVGEEGEDRKAAPVLCLIPLETGFIPPRLSAKSQEGNGIRTGSKWLATKCVLLCKGQPVAAEATNSPFEGCS